MVNIPKRAVKLEIGCASIVKGKVDTSLSAYLYLTNNVVVNYKRHTVVTLGITATEFNTLFT